MVRVGVQSQIGGYSIVDQDYWDESDLLEFLVRVQYDGELVENIDALLEALGLEPGDDPDYEAELRERAELYFMTGGDGLETEAFSDYVSAGNFRMLLCMKDGTSDYAHGDLLTLARLRALVGDREAVPTTFETESGEDRVVVPWSLADTGRIEPIRDFSEFAGENR